MLVTKIQVLQCTRPPLYKAEEKREKKSFKLNEKKTCTAGLEKKHRRKEMRKISLLLKNGKNHHFFYVFETRPKKNRFLRGRQKNLFGKKNFMGV